MKRRAARGCSLKTIKLGGLRGVMRAAELCQSLGMKVNLACKVAESGIAAASLMHLAAAVPAVEWGVSMSNQYLADDIVRATVKVVDGHAEVPAGVGLGVEVDEARVRKATREVRNAKYLETAERAQAAVVFRQFLEVGDDQIRLIRPLAERPFAAVDERGAHAGGLGADAIEGVVGDEQYFVHRHADDFAPPWYRSRRAA